LDKTVTVVPDTYFCDVEDLYIFEGVDTLTIAAGMNTHAALETVEQHLLEPGHIAIWEHASDQTYEPEDGMLGVAVVMPDADLSCFSMDDTHLLVCKDIVSGQPVRYSFGSCWSKGAVKTAEAWFGLVAGR
jgi:membrane-bound inhibitor of C-type lysozyme